MDELDMSKFDSVGKDKKSGVLQTMIIVVCAIIIGAGLFIGGAYYSNSRDKDVFTSKMNNTLANYSVTLQNTALDYYRLGYASAVKGLYSYAGNCSVVGVTDPVSNTTIKLQDVTCK